MKKLIILGSLSLFMLNGCGLFQAPPSPPPNKIMQNLQRVDSGTTINIVSLVPMDIPNPGQPKVINSAAFRVTDDVRGDPNSVVLIPQNSLITGVYSNDGHQCQISWQAIYPDYRSLEKSQGTFGIANMVKNTSCDPKLGITPGQLLTIIFK